MGKIFIRRNVGSRFSRDEKKSCLVLYVFVYKLTDGFMKDLVLGPKYKTRFLGLQKVQMRRFEKKRFLDSSRF